MALLPAESLDLSFLDDITNWDNFVPTPEMNDAFLRVLEEDIHPISCDQEPDENRPPVVKGKSSRTSGRFAPPVSKTTISRLSKPFVPKNTKQSTNWAVNNFRTWMKYHNEHSDEQCRDDLLENGSAEEMNKFLSLYILGTRQKDGKPYTPRAINSLLSGLLRYIREKNPQGDNLNFMDKNNKHFKGLNSVCDHVYRDMRANGIGVKPKQAPIITRDEEEILWQKGILGAHCPQSLLNSVFFFNGKNFHLRGGDEHRFLKISQIQRYSNPERYEYVENGSKNRSGGIRDFQKDNKVVAVYANPSAKDRCHVFLLDVYLSKLSPAARQVDNFYLRPMKSVQGETSWFSSTPVGRNVLSKMTKTMFIAAGMTEKEVSKHSLRASGTTELFVKGVPEKIIQQRTGHKSVDALRQYERTTESQNQAASNILNTQSAGTSFALEMEKSEDFRDAANDQTPKTVRKRSSPPRYLFSNCKVTILQSLEDCAGFDQFITKHFDAIP